MTTSTPATKTAMIFAGEIFDGRDTDHGKVLDLNDASHDVRVRAMPARHLGRVLEACTDEAKLLELTCTVALKDDKTGEVIDWVPVDATFIDNLQESCHVRLVEAAKRLNFSRAANWGHRQIEAKQFQAPLLLKADEMLSPVVEKMAHLLISSLRSSESPAGRSTKS
jgi:hypothetical protein